MTYLGFGISKAMLSSPKLESSSSLSIGTFSDISEEALLIRLNLEEGLEPRFPFCFSDDDPHPIDATLKLKIEWMYFYSSNLTILFRDGVEDRGPSLTFSFIFVVVLTH